MLGNALAGLQDLEHAVAQIQEAIDLDPNRSGSYMNLAALLFARRNDGAAEQAFKKATEIAPQLADTHLALANYYWASGRMTEAEIALRRAVVAQPKHVGANRAMATFYMASNRAAEAEQHFRAVVDLSGTAEARLSLADYYLLTKRSQDALPILDDLANDPRAFSVAKARIAAVLHSQGKRKEAHATIDQALARTPNDKVALIIKARMLLAENKPDEALPLAQQAIAVDPSFAPAHFTLGSVYVARHESARAQNAFAQVLRLNPRAVAAQLELSRLHLQQGGFESSVTMAQEAVANQPDNALAHLLLARALMGRGDLTEAEARMKELLADSPTSAPVNAQMGTLMLLRKDPATARKYFQRAAQLDPSLMEPLTGLVTVDISERRYSDARDRIEASLKTRPRDPERLLLAAGVYTVTADDSSAERVLRTLIEVDPSNLQAYGQLALIYYKQNRLGEALVEFEELSRRQKSSVAPETMLGMILQVSRKLSDAEPHYEKALNIDPSAAVAANNLAWIYTENGGSLDTALQLAQTAKLQLPDLAEVDVTLGWVYYKKEMLTLAVPRLEETVRRAPRKAVYQFHLGMAYAKAGNIDKAREALLAALTLDPNFSEAAEARRTLATLKAPAKPAATQTN
jgi:tetratricopeptide (TPR) repeat protein